MKKHPNLALSLLDDGISGSMPMNGDATRVPIKRRQSALTLLGSGTLVTSERDVSVLGSLCTVKREQWAIWKGYWSRARSDGDSGSKSLNESCAIAGGSMTRRSRSPNPQARAASGC